MCRLSLRVIANTCYGACSGVWRRRKYPPRMSGSTLSLRSKAWRVPPIWHFENWPENFFGDEMGEIAAISKASLARRLGQ